MKKTIIKDKQVSLLVLLMLIFLYAFISMTKYCFSSAMVYIVDEGYMTKFETGTIISAFWAVYTIMQVVGGVLADKWEPKSLITVGLIGAGLSNLAVYFWYDSYILTIIVWSLNAAFQFAVWPAVFKIISSMIASSHRSAGMVIITLANPAGILASYLVAALIDRWQTNFLVSAIGLFVIAVLWELSMGFASHFSEDNTAKANVVKDADDNIVKADESISMGKLIISSGLIFMFVMTFILFRYVKKNYKEE